MRRKLAIEVLILPVLFAGCSRLDSDGTRDAASAAEAQGRLAATREQAQLWKAAAKHAAAGGLDKLPVVENPVAQRPRVAVQDRRVQAQPFSFPKDLVAGVQVIAAPELPEARFAGVAQVARSEGERVDLDLGERRILSLYVRAGSSPLRIASEEKVRLDYRVSDDRSGRRAIVALRMQDGTGVVSLLESGSAPIAVQVPLFDLSATQVGMADKYTMDVEVRVGKERKVLSQGQVGEFPASRLSVGLVASVAHAGAQAAETEGSPYAIRIIAWPTR